MDILETAMQEINGVLEKVSRTELDAAVDLIQGDRRIFVDGEGRSGLMAKGFAMRLMHLNYTVFVAGETITPALKKDDVFIAVSGSGESSHVVADTRKAAAAGCRVLAVTSKPESTVASLASGILTVPGTVKGDAGSGRTSVQLLSSLFDQCLHITLDAVCWLVSRRDGLPNEKATQNHW